MGRLRLLSRLLERQLFHIYAGRYLSAGALQNPIEELAASLEQSPPAGSPEEAERLFRRCVELNEVVSLRFQDATDDLRDTIRAIVLERAVQSVTGRPQTPTPDGPKTVDKTLNK